MDIFLSPFALYRIACISCPTLYARLVEMKSPDCETVLLEYDRRFEIYGDNFVFYDYNNPLNLPGKLAEHSFDMVIADPPFLSDECLRKTLQTVSFLAKRKILLCTGKYAMFSLLCYCGVVGFLVLLLHFVCSYVHVFIGCGGSEHTVVSHAVDVAEYSTSSY